MREDRRPRTVTDEEGESLLGWLVRAAQIRGHADVGELLERCGLPRSSRLRAVITSDIPKDRLASLLNAPSVDRVRDMTLTPADEPGFARFGATILRRTDVVVLRRRFSSAALALRPIHRQAWMIGSLPFCPIAFDFLKDSCLKCGTIQRWRPTANIARCDRCGSRLERQASRSVERGLIDGLKDFAHHAGLATRRHGDDVEPLPEPVRSLGGELIYEAVNELATLLDGRLRGKRHAADAETWQVPRTDALARAWDMVRRWPEPFLDLVMSVALGREGSRNIHRVLANDRSYVHPTVHALLLGDFAGKRDGLDVDGARVALGVTDYRVNMAQLARTVASRPVFRAGLLRLAFDAAELEHLGGIRADRIGERKAGVTLGVPAYCVLDLIDADILAVERHPWLLDHYGRPQLTRRSIADLLSRIKLASSSEVGESIDLLRALRGFGGGPKPWVQVVSMLLSGKLPHRWVGNGETLASVQVSATGVRTILDLPPAAIRADYSQEDAAEIINIKHVKISPDEWARLRSGAPTSGRVHGGRLAARAATRITAGEISARSGLASVAIAWKLKARGFERIDEFGYERSAVIQDLENVLS